jgi:hypothetical protein
MCLESCWFESQGSVASSSDAVSIASGTSGQQRKRQRSKTSSLLFNATAAENQPLVVGPMGALDFMKKKETLQTAYEALAKLCSGPNSLTTQLEKQLAMLPNGVTVQLEKDTVQIQANFKLVVAKVAAAVIDNAGLKKIERDIVAADQKYSDILKEFNEGSAELSEHLDAATFLCDKKKGHDRLSAGKQRYEKNKVEIQTRFYRCKLTFATYKLNLF